MEYKTILGKFDWDTVRRGKFQGKSGKFTTLARIIYNGLSYNFGSQDGAVTMLGGLTTWRFIAPVGRFDMTDYTGLSLRDALAGMSEDAMNVPIPAWDEFFSFLSGREDLVNASIQPNVIFVGGIKVDLPFLQNCSTFSEFINWLNSNMGAAGNLPASEFVHGQDMAIPMEMYSATISSVTLKKPTDMPAYSSDVDVIDSMGNGYASYGKLSGTYTQPVFVIKASGCSYVYSFVAPTTDANGTIVPLGWSMAYDSANGLQYTPIDIVANPVTIQADSGATMKNYIAKLFVDIEYDLSTAEKKGEINYVFRA